LCCVTFVRLTYRSDAKSVYQILHLTWEFSYGVYSHLFMWSIVYLSKAHMNLHENYMVSCVLIVQSLGVERLLESYAE